MTRIKAKNNITTTHSHTLEITQSMLEIRRKILTFSITKKRNETKRCINTHFAFASIFSCLDFYVRSANKFRIFSFPYRKIYRLSRLLLRTSHLYDSHLKRGCTHIHTLLLDIPSDDRSSFSFPFFSVPGSYPITECVYWKYIRANV